MLNKMILEEPIQAAIWDCLNHYDYEDATFLAERLWTEVDTDETLYLLATCYYRAGKKSQAYALLKTRLLSSPRTKFLCAKCCFDFGRFSEAETILLGKTDLKLTSLEGLICKEYGQEAAFVLQLLGHIYYKTERSTNGLLAFKASLAVNPLLWISYQELCVHGVRINPDDIFRMELFEKFNKVGPRLNVGPAVINVDVDTRNTGKTNSRLTSTSAAHTGKRIKFNGWSATAQKRYPFIRTLSPSTKENGFEIKYGFSPFSSSFAILPEEINQNESKRKQPEKTSSSSCKIIAGPSEQKVLTQLQCTDDVTSPLFVSRPVFSQYVNSDNSMDKRPQERSLQIVRKSSRIGNHNYSVKENNELSYKTSVSNKTFLTKFKSGKVLRNSKKIYDNTAKMVQSETESSAIHCVYEEAVHLQKKSLEGLLSLLKIIGIAYQHLCMYECEIALKYFDKLPIHQKNSCTILSWIGKMYVEMHDYKGAVRYFRTLQQKDQAVIDGMDLYSTALWHLHKEKELSYLAQLLMKLDRLHPSTWCVAGNLLSLEKEHDSAIKYFQRAVQLNPQLVYAYTLLGHEYVVIEEYEKALSCFRAAICVQPNHYNAWYGLASIHVKQEKYTLAESYLKKALSLHPKSTVILCHLALVQNALQKPQIALQTIEKAILINPNSAVCKYHRASLCFKMSDYDRALAELIQLKELTPRESLVYYLMGEIHKKLHNPHLALMCFNWATDLDPKGTNSIVKDSTSDPLLNPCLNNELTPIPVSSPSDSNSVVATDRNSMNQRQSSSPPNNVNNIINSYIDTSP